MFLAVVTIVVLCFGLVVFFGAPYVPSFHKQAEVGLDLLNLSSGDTLIELGSGDGRVMKLAAKKGFKVVGYELNPILVLISYFVTIRYRKNIRIIWGNYWRKDLKQADGIFVFLIGRYMEKLNNKLEQYPYKPIKVASFAFQIPHKKAQKTKDGVYLYKY